MWVLVVSQMGNVQTVVHGLEMGNTNGALIGLNNGLDMGKYNQSHIGCLQLSTLSLKNIFF